MTTLKEIHEKRILIEDAFKSKKAEVHIAGWADNIRELGKIRFLVIRDASGTMQVTAVRDKVDKKVFDAIGKITRESIVYVKGKLKDTKQAPGGREIVPDEIEVLNEAEEIPIDISDDTKTELPKRLDYRFVDLHRRKVQSIFKIQAEISTSFREYFKKEGFTEVQLPSVISAASEGGTELFSVQYFEKKAFLAQSPQLYKQMLACSIEKVFTITPVWRAEKHNTIRHLNESRQMDIEVAFAGQMEVMKKLEEAVRFIVENVIKNCKKELEVLGLKLKVPKGIYLDYEDAIKKVGGKIGEDFTPEQERKLCDMYSGDIVFTHSWPASIKPFYIMPQGEKKDAKTSQGFDALYKGVEISSGGQRIHIPELLIERLKMKKMNPANFKSYIDSFRYGAPPHAGWSIGLERFTTTLLGLDNIREAVLFPRDRDRLTP